MKNILRYWKEAKTLDRLIMLSVFALFLPYYIHYITIIAVLGYSIINHDFRMLILGRLQNKIIFAFSLLSICVSLLYHNFLGAACAILFYTIFLFIFYYQKKIHRDLFKIIIEIICYASLISIIYSTIQYLMICGDNNLSPLSFKVLNRPENRIRAGFFNANYYAMCLEFVLLCCTYRIIQISHLYKAKIYVGIALLNMVALYFSGTRSAWIPLVIAVLYMLIANAHWRYTSYALLVLAGGILSLVLFPQVFQRINVFNEIDKRMLIWMTAIKGIKAHPLFGQGPLTYIQIFEQYAGHPTQHAHNVFLDPLLSYGIVGCTMILSYAGIVTSKVLKILKNKECRPLFHLVIGCTIIILVHGITDYTIYWPQCAILYFVLLMGIFAYGKKEVEDEL